MVNFRILQLQFAHSQFSQAMGMEFSSSERRKTLQISFVNKPVIGSPVSKKKLTKKGSLRKITKRKKEN